ncbi:MAG: hypothetical protein BWY61_01736 [Firmicutes bacterium ADurb.Bin354]|nr:MAG: hypothetical protein BWY61_01736 [Firmicutes bacterium ADurb.Bin354]
MFIYLIKFSRFDCILAIQIEIAETEYYFLTAGLQIVSHQHKIQCLIRLIVQAVQIAYLNKCRVLLLVTPLYGISYIGSIRKIPVSYKRHYFLVADLLHSFVQFDIPP